MSLGASDNSPFGVKLGFLWILNLTEGGEVNGCASTLGACAFGSVASAPFFFLSSGFLICVPRKNESFQFGK